MPPTAKQRTFVWLGVLVFLIYLVASRWHSLRHGIGGFYPLEGPMLLLLVVGVALNVYWPPARRPRWFEVLTWAAVMSWTLYFTVLALRQPLGWKIDMWPVVTIVIIGVWGYSLLYPHGKLWRAFHPGEWGDGRENQRR
jgi:hypothetical protein